MIGPQISVWIVPGAMMFTTSSSSATYGMPRIAVYAATKHAVKGLTEALSIEWARHGITVNAIAPTFVNTPFVAALLQAPEIRQEVLSRIPLGRLAETEDIVGAVLYLASSAAAMVTGHTLVIDGGWTAW